MRQAIKANLRTGEGILNSRCHGGDGNGNRKEKFNGASTEGVSNITWKIKIFFVMGVQSIL